MTPRIRWSSWGVRFAAAAALGIIAVIGARALDWWDPHAYRTATGEQRTVVLSDGTRMELNTRTRVRVRYGAQERQVLLEKGEAFFNVARDTARPFRVISERAIIRALGTQFDVYRQANTVSVTVIEGRVAVAPSAKPLELAAGQQTVLRAVVSPAQNAALATSAATVDVRRVISWRQHRLIFENESLAGAAAEFNRYNANQLVIRDPLLGARRISGVFNSNRPAALVDFLIQKGEIRATPLSGSRVLLERGN